jgi:hypothetical protein
MLEDLLLKWLIHKAGKLVQVVGRKPAFFAMWTFPKDCLSVLIVIDFCESE